MMTLTGEYIGRETGAPSVEAIALGLSRMPRFAGQTLFEWNVADHLVVCVRYMQRWFGGDTLYGWNLTPLMPLHVLLHDAHESMTGDIPTTFKTHDMRALQKDIDVRIYKSLNLVTPTADEAALIKVIDGHMLLAEAKVCAPWATYVKIMQERAEDIAGPLAVEVVEEYLHEDRNSEQAFLGLANELLSNAYYGKVGV